jgi:hypothetical protein
MLKIKVAYIIWQPIESKPEINLIIDVGKDSLKNYKY